MPRSGPNGTYTLPGAQATQVAGTPIPSAVNNQGYSDIEQTFNTPQPIAYGGTAATNASGARVNLGLNIGVDIPSIGQTKILSLPNYVVNGSMTVSQENGNTLGTTNGYFPADQWAMYFTAATAAMSIQRIQTRTLANAGSQLEYKCTTAKASLGASDNVLISQPIEGAWFQQAGFGTASAQRLVMRFQVSLPAGLYHWHFANSAGNRHCSVPFTIAAGEANTAVVKEIVVPPDTSGTWPTAEGVIGIVADLVLAAGATVTGGTASTWGATTYYAASTQFNILSSTANAARLADVGLKIDPDATGVYGQYEVGEVDAVYRSERYWFADSRAFHLYLRGTTTPSAAVGLVVFLQIPMCKAPVASLSGGANVTGLVASDSSPRGFLVTGTATNTATPSFSTFLVNARL